MPIIATKIAEIAGIITTQSHFGILVFRRATFLLYSNCNDDTTTITVLLRPVWNFNAAEQESQRDSIPQPRVSPSRTGEELPWDTRLPPSSDFGAANPSKIISNPNGVASPFPRAWIQQPFNRSGVSVERRIFPLHYIFQMAAFSRKPLRGAPFTPLHDSHRTHVKIFPRLPLSPVEAGGEIWGEYFLCHLAGF